MTKRPLSITFVSPKRYSFYPPDYTGRGLGGSESALVLLSRALKRRGHDVDVYNCCYKPGEYDGVEWKPLWSFDPTRPRDAVISLRLLETFDRPVSAAIRSVWIHDDSLVGAGAMDASGQVNRWIAVSETEKASILRTETIDESRWFVTNNALDEDIYDDALRLTEKIPGRMVYCSAPDRGLEYLLEYWGEIKARVPQASLVITGSFALWGNADEENQRFFSDMYEKAKALPDIRLLGRASKREVALLQAQSELMAYPCSFDEMFCISALECLAVGTPIVTTRRAALKERILDGQTGYLIDGHPRETEFRKKFVEGIASLLGNRKQLKAYAETSKTLAKNVNYANLAASWESKFFDVLSA